MGIRRIFILGLVIGFSVMTGQAFAAAPKIAPQTCDPQYWKSMNAKAWLEAEREIIQNQNLIFKPDSVLEYTCFDRFLSHTAKHAGDIFVHTAYFGRIIIPRGSKKDPTSMEWALQNVVTDSLKPYINTNFGHKFLGERSKDMGGSISDRDLGDATSLAPYDGCDVMAKIWKDAKCINFIDNTKFEGDGFFPFDDIKDANGDVKVEGYKTIDDPRKYPTACDKWVYWDANIKDATNTASGGELYVFKEPVKETYNLIRPKLEPGSCSQGLIITGVTVKTSQDTEGYPDGICTNPGCTYNGEECE